MPKKSQQQEFKKVGGWGGKRKHAGRSNKSDTVNHMPRPEVDFKKPLQITHKLLPGLTTLRRKDVLKAFQEGAARTKRFDMHVIHFSLISNHIHMLVEARNKKALESGMRSLAAKMAKLVGKLSEHKGPVFKGRYHLEVIKNPTHMKRSLFYVLLNQAKHSKMLETMDPFSSAKYFPDWRKLMGRNWNGVLDWEERGISAKLEEAGLSPPRSWLMRISWMRAAH